MSDCNCIAEIKALENLVEERFAARLPDLESRLRKEFDQKLSDLELRLTGRISDLEGRVRAAEVVNAEQDATSRDHGAAIMFLQQHRVRIVQRVLDGRNSSSIAMEGGTLFSVVTEVQENGAVHPAGSIVVARDVAQANAAALGTVLFWCDGAYLHCKGAMSVNYRIVFVTHGTVEE